MVNRQLVTTRLLSAVLAGETVSLEYVASAEGHRSRRQSVELRQRDDFRHAEPLAYCLNERLVTVRNQLRPVVPVVQLVVDRVDNLSRLVPQHDQRTRNRSDVDRLPVTVENQRRSLQYLGHVSSFTY